MKGTIISLPIPGKHHPDRDCGAVFSNRPNDIIAVPRGQAACRPPATPGGSTNTPPVRARRPGSERLDHFSQATRLVRGRNFTPRSVSWRGGEWPGEKWCRRTHATTTPSSHLMPKFLKGHSTRNKVMSCAHRFYRINIIKRKNFSPTSRSPDYPRAPRI